MPIYTNTQELSQIGIADAIIAPELERLTGADILISPVKLPPSNEKLVNKLIETGAVLIQRKTGMDLIASLGPRMDDALATMRTIPGIAPFQCVLMFCGVLDISPTGYAIVDGRYTDTPYLNVISAIDAWQMRGGTYINLKDNSMIAEYVSQKEKRIGEYLAKETKTVYPPPLQNLVGVHDWRVTLATFPLIGGVRANNVKKYLIDNKLGDSLLQALVMLTSGEFVGPDGVGKTIMTAAREWLGLPDGWVLDIKPEETQNERSIPGANANNG